MIRASIGILTFNRRDALARAIDSALRQTYRDVEVVVVDSASTDGTEEMVRSRFPQASYVRLPRNLGCPEGRNHVFANCRGEFVVCLDDDGYLEPNVVELVVQAFESDPSIGTVAFRQRFEGEEGSLAYSETKLEDVGNFSGGVAAFRRGAIAATGGYPGDFFLFGEESYLVLKLFECGYRIVSEPDAVMWHPRLGSSSSVRFDYFRFRNPILIVVRLFPLGLVPKFMLGRLARYFFLSLSRGTFLEYLRAVAAVALALPCELAARKPVGRPAVEAYFRLRPRD
jgi:GT2 family glycosyltransferase